MLSSWIWIIILGSLGIFFIAGNAWIFWIGWVKKKKSPSVTPFLGEVFTMIAFYIIPGNRYQYLSWIPLILDWGCIPMIIRFLYFIVFVHPKEEKRWNINYMLNTNFSTEEIAVLRRNTYNQHIILNNTITECYILNELGEFRYEQCFEQSAIEEFQCKKYRKVKPNRIVQYQKYYFMESITEPKVWYRGIMHDNGNYEFDVFFNSLEEALKITLKSMKAT